ncbi:MAG: methyltransferase domain-containing protein [Burkholderiales bacterium]
MNAINLLRTIAVAAALAATCVPPAAAQPAASGADPRINERFYDPDLGEWTARFEGESREIYALRQEIVTASGVKAGMTVADVGAGSGFMAMLFARQVGAEGRVIAAEISRPFAAAIAGRAKKEGVQNVTTVIGTQAETGLPADSVDIVFTSDVYHHFEQVAATLASIKRALKTNGRFIVVDFERIPGVSSQNTLNHVRAGKETVIEEVLAAGFRLREEVKKLGLKTNYYLIFERL